MVSSLVAVVNEAGRRHGIGCPEAVPLTQAVPVVRRAECRLAERQAQLAGPERVGDILLRVLAGTLCLEGTWHAPPKKADNGTI